MISYGLLKNHKKRLLLIRVPFHKMNIKLKKGDHWIFPSLRITSKGVILVYDLTPYLFSDHKYLKQDKEYQLFFPFRN